MLDLVLPQECGGCGSPGTPWCPDCTKALAVRPDEPHVVIPRTDPGVAVFALGRYTGPRRRAIVAAKEHGRTDLLVPLGAALSAGVDRLLTWGVLQAPVSVVPAPTRWLSARRRGGDPVAQMAKLTEKSGVATVPALRTRAWVRDSVGLSSSARQRNIAGRIRVVKAVPQTGEVVLVDDIVTTGTTVTESVRVLRGAGVRVAAVLVLAHA